jgi:tetratricopeptide (TPR) repeat protein
MTVMPDEQLPTKVPDDFEELVHQYAALFNAGQDAEAAEVLEKVMALAEEGGRELLQHDPDFQESLLADALAQDGQWQEAQAIYERRLARVSLDDALGRSRAYKDLAAHHAILDELDLAAAYMAIAIKSLRDWKTVENMAEVALKFDLRFDATIALRQKRYSAALASCHEALSYSSDDRLSDLPRALLFISRAHCWLGLHDIATAKADLAIAWELLAPQMHAESPVGTQMAFAEWWEVAAKVCEYVRDFERATYAWDQGVFYNRRAAEQWGEKSPGIDLSLASRLNNLARTLLRLGREQAAESFAESDAIRHRYHLAPLDRETIG